MQWEDSSMENDAESRELDKRMQRIERDIAEIKVALLGNVMDGTTGILGRVRDRERTAADHDLRIVRLETAKDNYATKHDLASLKEEVNENTEWRQRVMWMIAGAAATGALTGGGIVALIMQALGA